MADKKKKVNYLFKLSYLNRNFALTLGYLNPALNSMTQVYKRAEVYERVGKIYHFFP